MEFWGSGGSYGAWCDYLDRWSASDGPDTDLPPALQPSDFDGPTWSRLMMRIQDAVNLKIGRWQDVLVRTLRNAVDEFSCGRALADARTGLKTLRQFASLSSLTDDLRSQLTSQIDAVISSAQQQLEEDAQRAIRQGPGGSAEMVLRQLRLNPLTAAFQSQQLLAEPPLRPLLTTNGTRRRQILID